MTKFKYENIVFIGLIAMYLVGALERNCSLLTNLTTLSTQILMCYGVKYLLRYTRRNAKEIKKSINIMLMD